MTTEYIKLDSSEPIINIANIIRDKIQSSNEMSLEEIKIILNDYWITT